MKKLTLFIAVLLTALAGSINAQKDYGIDIAGVKVTSDNCNNITGSTIEGKVSYNDESKTLTLDNATIEGDIYFGEYSSRIEDITITLVGENSIEGGIETVSGTKTINGTGSLKVGTWINCYNEKNTIIEDCTIEIDATPEGWDWATYGPISKLTIKNANLSAEGLGVAIGYFYDIELIGCEIVEPVNAQIIDNEYDGHAGKYICDGDGNIAKKVVIKPISYGITIAGVEVTSANCTNITGSNIEGKVSYNPETNTLTLDNATIEGSVTFGTGSDRLKDITITLVGDNTVNNTIGSVANNKTINGNGSLKAKADLSCYNEQNTLIEDCTIEIDAPADLDWVMFGGNKGTILTIKNANLSSKGGAVAIGDFADIELIGCEIVEPVNAQILDTEFEGDGGKYICNEDGTIAKKVVIKKITDYGITVAGIAVTSANCTNITGEGITGFVSYNDESKTLTLDNATIKEGNILFGSEDITITLVGENSIEGSIGSVRGTKTINGTGSLKVVGDINCNYEKNTIIEDCTIEIDATPKGWNWVIYGDCDNTKLTIKNANVSAQSLGVAIGDFVDIELVGCEIVEPANAQIIDNEFDGAGVGKYICNEDGTIAKKVVIKKLSGLNDIAQSSINIYPNPASDFVTIEGKGEIVITNSIGQVVKEIKDNNTYRTLNIKDFERGVYYIKVGDTTQKLVIE